VTPDAPSGSSLAGPGDRPPGTSSSAADSEGRRCQGWVAGNERVSACLGAGDLAWAVIRSASFPRHPTGSSASTCQMESCLSGSRWGLPTSNGACHSSPGEARSIFDDPAASPSDAFRDRIKVEGLRGDLEMGGALSSGGAEEQRHRVPQRRHPTRTSLRLRDTNLRTDPSCRVEGGSDHARSGRSVLLRGSRLFRLRALGPGCGRSRQAACHGR
jgi:hypothetical protein